MKVKTRLLYIFWLSDFVAITAGFLLFYNAHIISVEIDRLDAIGSIRQGVTEITGLRNQYLMRQSESLVMQIRQRAEGIAAVMETARGMFSESGIVASFDDMLRLNDQNIEKFRGLQQSVAAADSAARDALVAHMRDNSNAVLSMIHDVDSGLLTRLHSLQERMMVLIIVFTLTLLIGISTAVGIIWSYIVKRIILIRQGSSVIAGGNFHFTWSDDTDDEIGELSKDLAAMATELSASYGKLEGKVRERTRELEETKDSLEIKVRELEEANVKNQAILASMDDGFIATDKDGNVMLVNPKAEKLLGWRATNVMGRPLSAALTVRDESGRILPETELPMHLVKQRKEALHISSNYEFARSDGSAFPVYIAAAPIVLGGKIIGALEVFRDITEEKKIERSKSEFISVAAHQLRTPAAAMNWYLERLIRGRIGKLSGKQLEYFEEIERNNHRMIKLVNTLLNVSRLEIGALKIQPAELDIRKLVGKILAELRPMIEKKHIVIETAYDTGLAAYFDPEWFAIVISNILSNAVNYTPPRGTVSICTKLVRGGTEVGGRTQPRDAMLICVTDTGYGIPEREQSHLFTKFFRANNARKKHTDGNGLGLYIVKSILDQAGGSIWFSSAEERGTTFYITLPLKPEDKPPRIVAEAET